MNGRATGIVAPLARLRSGGLELRVEQAGVVAFRVVDGSPEVLVVTARKDPTVWIFPKGHVETGETLFIAALRELREEAGVTACIVGTLQSLQFVSGTDPVTVHYFLAMDTGRVQAKEGRQLAWLAPEEAISRLTHEDARHLLRSALPALELVARRKVPGAADDGQFRELLLAEYAHTAESLLRNEEDGEKRATFFMTVVAATGAALGFLLDKDNITPRETNPLIAIALAVVALFGYFTFIRTVARNLTSDRYKAGLNRIRKWFLVGSDDSRAAFLAFNPLDGRSSRRTVSWKSIGKGGWLETLAAVEAMVLGGFVAACASTQHWWQDGMWAAGAALVSWTILISVAKRKLERTSSGELHD